MRGFALANIFLIFFIPTNIWGQEKKVNLNFSLLRQHDDVSGLVTIEDKSLYQSLKYTSFGKGMSISFGGSVRLQAESFTNELFIRSSNQDRLWILNRNMLHAHLRWKNKLELFAELNNSLIFGKINEVPVDRDELGINQLFVKFHPNDLWQITLGRENLNLGGRRLVDLREGPNVRRTFDLLQVDYIFKNLRFKAFGGTLVHPEGGIFDNRSLTTEEIFTGIYATHKLNDKHSLEYYFLFQKEDSVRYDIGVENENRASLGIRHSGNINSFYFNNEVVYQFGSFGNMGISAWTISFQLENRAKLFQRKLNYGIKTELISGDKENSQDVLNTFDALYPRGAYFGRVARFGPSNLIDVHPYANIVLGKLFIELDYDVFWRYSLDDGIYNPALLLDYPDLNDRRFIAEQFGSLFSLGISNNMSLEVETNFVFPRAFLEESGLPDNLFHFVITHETKF